MSSFLVIKINEQYVAILAKSIQRVVRVVEMTPMVTTISLIEGVIDIHGSVVPVVFLSKLLNNPQKELTLDNVLVVTQVENFHVALLADDVEGVYSLEAFEPEFKNEKELMIHNTQVVHWNEELLPVLNLEPLLQERVGSLEPIKNLCQESHDE